MTTDKPAERFDCIRFVREVRDRKYEITKDMSPEEYRRWMDTRRPTDPKLAALWDEMRPPEELVLRPSPQKS